MADKKTIRIMTGKPGELGDQAGRKQPQALGRLGKVLLILSLLANAALAAGLLATLKGRPAGEPPPASVDIAEGYYPATAMTEETDVPAKGVAAAFQWACGAHEVTDAVRRLESFVKERVPPMKSWNDQGAWDDEDHWKYALASTYELMRAYYLAGDALRGDAILRELQEDHKSR